MQPAHPPRSIQGIALILITSSIQTPDHGPVTTTTWAIGETEGAAFRDWKAKHPKQMPCVTGYEVVTRPPKRFIPNTELGRPPGIHTPIL